MADPTRDPDPKAPEPPTTELARALTGEPGFSELHARLAPALFAWAELRIPASVRRHFDPADLVQEVFLRALRRGGTFDPARCPFRAWLFRIATNVLLEGLRAAAAHRTVRDASGSGTGAFRLAEIPAEITTITRRAALDEGVQRFVALIASLDPVERRLLAYRGLEGLSHAVVAERLGLGLEAAAKRWERLRKRLESDPATLGLLAEGS